MGAARVLIFASESYEPLASTILEAFSQGTPVLAASVESINDLVKEGVTGLQFAVGDAADLAAKANQLSLDTPSYRDMRRNCRSLYEERYTEPQNYRMLSEIYARAIESRHSQGAERHEPSANDARDKFFGRGGAMSIALITGSAGLVGSEATRHFAKRGMDIVGVDNDMRSVFFGSEASTSWMARDLAQTLPNYVHSSVDIRDQSEIFNIFRRYGPEIKLVIHTAAQPSHDWAAREPLTDFQVNALGTLNMLEATRQYCAGCRFHIYLDEQGLWRRG